MAYIAAKFGSATTALDSMHTPEPDAPKGWGKYKLDGPFGPVILFRRSPVPTQ